MQRLPENAKCAQSVWIPLDKYNEDEDIERLFGAQYDRKEVRRGEMVYYGSEIDTQCDFSKVIDQLQKMATLIEEYYKKGFNA